METNRKALGRGLEQLFSNESLYSNPLDTLDKMVEETPKEEVVEVKLSELRSNPYQPRRNFDEEKLKELSESIKEFGVLEPILIKKSIHGYEIIAGERRYRASQMAGLETIPAVIKDFSDENMMQIALLENIQREDLSAIEEAEAYSKLVRSLGISQEELARRMGKSRSHITNMIGLLKLPEEIKQDVVDGLISMGHARVLSKLEDKNKIMELANKIKSNHMSVRDLESIASSNEYKRVNPTTPKVKEPSRCSTFTISNACSFRFASVQKTNLSIVVGFFSVAMILPINLFIIFLLSK